MKYLLDVVELEWRFFFMFFFLFFFEPEERVAELEGGIFLSGLKGLVKMCWLFLLVKTR